MNRSDFLFPSPFPSLLNPVLPLSYHLPGSDGGGGICEVQLGSQNLPANKKSKHLYKMAQFQSNSIVYNSQEKCQKYLT